MIGGCWCCRCVLVLEHGASDVLYHHVSIWLPCRAVSCCVEGHVYAVRKLLDTPDYGCKAVNLGEWDTQGAPMMMCCVLACNLIKHACLCMFLITVRNERGSTGANETETGAMLCMLPC
jgi:hypothetical protein